MASITYEVRVHDNGVIEWRAGGLLHRENGPAWAQGSTKLWYRNGNLLRWDASSAKHQSPRPDREDLEGQLDQLRRHVGAVEQRLRDEIRQAENSSSVSNYWEGKFYAFELALDLLLKEAK